MTASTFLALVGIWVAAIASPGPDLVQIIRLGAKTRAAGIACAVGIMVGNAIWIIASLLGLSALIQAAPQVLAVLQLAGGAYLLYMGLTAMRAGWNARRLSASFGAGAPGGAPGHEAQRDAPLAPSEPRQEPETAESSASSESSASWGPFGLGLATNLSNPKAVLFFGAVFAQFIKPGMGWQWMSAIALTLVIIGIAWFVGFALVVDKLAGFLKRWGYAVDVVTGAIFAALAVWMIVEGSLGLVNFL